MIGSVLPRHHVKPLAFRLPTSEPSLARVEGYFSDPCALIRAGAVNNGRGGRPFVQSIRRPCFWDDSHMGWLRAVCVTGSRDQQHQGPIYRWRQLPIGARGTLRNPRLAWVAGRLLRARDIGFDSRPCLVTTRPRAIVAHSQWGSQVAPEWFDTCTYATEGHGEAHASEIPTNTDKRSVTRQEAPRARCGGSAKGDRKLGNIYHSHSRRGGVSARGGRLGWSECKQADEGFCGSSYALSGDLFCGCRPSRIATTLVGCLG